MLVCHCTGVSDRAIRKLVRDGAMTLDEVSRSCGAGSCCGGCVPAVEEVIHNEASHRGAAETTGTGHSLRVSS